MRAAVAERGMPPWAEPLARTGYATKGVVYVLMGGIAVLAALGEGGRVRGSAGAVRWLGGGPWGDALLVAAGVGLLAYAAWRLIQAAFDLQPHRGGVGLANRLGFVVSAAMHGALASVALQLARGERAGGEGVRGWVARALDAPGGRLAVGAIGLGLIGHALYQAYCAIVARLDPTLRIGGLDRDDQRWLTRLARAGLGARAVVFALIGVGLVRAATSARAEASRDTAGALREVAAWPHGDLILAIVAAGLAAYGLYMLAAAVAARIAPR